MAGGETTACSWYPSFKMNPSEAKDEVGLLTLSKYSNPEECMSRGLYLCGRGVVSARFDSEAMWVGTSGGVHGEFSEKLNNFC